jgi:hypothetical protein
LFGRPAEVHNRSFGARFFTVPKNYTDI